MAFIEDAIKTMHLRNQHVLYYGAAPRGDQRDFSARDVARLAMSA